MVITRTEFVEPGRPTALAKCSAKGELLQPHRVNLDLSGYTDLSIGELVSGYISQVHKSRDAEVAMVTQIQQKSEVTSFCPLIYCLVTYTMLAPKSTTYDSVRCRLRFRLTQLSRQYVDRYVQHALAPKCQVPLLGKRLGLI